MTFQRISFGEKRGCVALGQSGAGLGIEGDPGEAENGRQQ